MKDLLRALQADLGEFMQEVTVEIRWQPPEGGPSSQGSGVGGVSGPVGDRPTSGPDISRVIELHPDARTNFDSKAESLLSMLVSTPVAPAPDGGVARNPGEQIVTQLPPHATSAETTLFRNGEGTTAARAFIQGGFVRGLQGEGYDALRILAEAMQRTEALRGLVASDTLEELIFTWVRARVTGLTAQPMSEVVLGQAAARLAEVEVILPLFRVELAEPLQVGQVTLRTITEGDFTRWESVATQTGAGVTANLRALMLLERKRMRGYAAATMKMFGERERILEIALEEADKAVAMLRLFSPAILSPRARSFCALWGRESIEAPAYLLFGAARSGVAFGSFVDTSQDFVSRFDAARVRLIRQQALDPLIQSLFEGAPTEFRDEIRSVLILYSQSALRTAPIEKLLAILLPLESFLLRNMSESITENIAIRFALAIGETHEERRKIRAVAQDVYGMRSRYLHHRKPIGGREELEQLREFMLYAWRFFMDLGLRVVSRYRDRTEYLAELDDRKLASGA